LYGIPSKKAQQRIDELLDLMKLSDRKNERIEKLSTGMRQKVSIARAILHDPKVLLLDEPTLGLDPSFSRFLRKFIKEELNKKEGKTILLTTHYMEEADQLCDRIAFINEGRIVACDTPENLKKSIPQEEVLELECLGALSNDWRKVEGVSNLYTREEKGICVLRLQAENTEDVMSDVIDEVRKQAKILSVKVSKPTLEDVFIHLTGSKLRGGGQDEPRA
ncbi:MAG: ATP-binding cassette domain-containing protein, partial [Candidatus Methanofastidiosia archaeon]